MFIKRTANRVAIVLGNGAYQHEAALKNPHNDAEAMAESLEAVGFVVTRGVDLDHAAIEHRFREFEESCDGADVALLYYSGHGLQVGGENYLVPLGAEIAGDGSLSALIPVQSLIDRISRRVDTRIFLLDACRSNPFATRLAADVLHAKGLPRPNPGEGVETVNGGLAEFDSGPGSYLAFAAAPGHVAYEGMGENSFFTQALLTHIRTYGLEINALMNRVRSDVLRDTDYRQTPWGNSSLSDSFWFRPKSVIPIIVLTFLGIVSAFVCNLSDAHTWDDIGAWKLLGVFVDGLDVLISRAHETDRVDAPAYYKLLYVNPMQGIVFGCVIGVAVWVWGRRAWWSALTAFAGTLVAWFAAVTLMIDYSLPLIRKSIENDVALVQAIEVLHERSSLLFLNIAGATGAMGVYFGSAAVTPALRTLSIVALTVAAGVAMVWPVYLIQEDSLLTLIESDNLLMLYLAWQPAVAASLGYGLAIYVPPADDI